MPPTNHVLWAIKYAYCVSNAERYNCAAVALLFENTVLSVFNGSFVGERYKWCPLLRHESLTRPV